MTSVSAPNLGYLPVSLATLQAQSVMECDLFIESDASRGHKLLYRQRGIPLDDSDLRSLREWDVGRVFIRVEDHEAFRDYLRDKVLNNGGLSATARVAALRDLTRVQFREAMQSASCDALVEMATEFGQSVVDVLTATPVEFPELITLLDHDYYTFTHVCNVTMYCVLLAQRLGMNDAAELAQMATGAMLHDIGKRTIPAAVLNKRSSLSDDEWDLIQQHPTDGYRQLWRRSDVTWPQLMMVYQHHERLDGSGYPAGAVKDDIHRWALICTVADVFDALTCVRPYRRPMTVAEAHEHFRQHAGNRYDAEIVEALLAGTGRRVTAAAPAAAIPMEAARPLAEELIEAVPDFFEKSGPLANAWNDMRQYRRFHYRRSVRATVYAPRDWRQTVSIGMIVTCDVSRCGVRILLREQLFPGQQVELDLDTAPAQRAEVMWCHRVGKYFQAGCRFGSSEVGSGRAGLENSPD